VAKEGDLKEPEYLKGSRDIGAETVRVTGDVKIPDGENVRFTLIVLGDLAAGKNVNFLGGLHVEGNLRLGELNYVKGSVHCEGNMMIGSQTKIEEAAYCLGMLLIGKGVKVGFGETGGGLVCRSAVYVEQEFTAGMKLEAEKIVTVEKIDEKLISEFERTKPKPRQHHPGQLPPASQSDQDKSDSVSLWKKTEHRGSAGGT